MKASELIALIEAQMLRYGDLDIAVVCQGYELPFDMDELHSIAVCIDGGGASGEFIAINVVTSWPVVIHEEGSR